MLFPHAVCSTTDTDEISCQGRVAVCSWLPWRGSVLSGAAGSATVMLVVYVVSLVTVLMPVMSASTGLSE